MGISKRGSKTPRKARSTLTIKSRSSTGSVSWLWRWAISILKIYCTEISSQKIYFWQKKTKLRLVTSASQRCWTTPLTWLRQPLVPLTTCHPRCAWGNSTTTSQICGCLVASFTSCAPPKDHSMAHLSKMSSIKSQMSITKSSHQSSTPSSTSS